MAHKKYVFVVLGVTQIKQLTPSTIAWPLPSLTSQLMICKISLAAPPLQKEEGSGTAPLLELFCSPEILGNINMQILCPQHDHDMQARTTTMLMH